MSAPVTQLQFYEEMQKLRSDFQSMHTRTREQMTEGFLRMGEKLDAHAKEDLLVDRRVLTLENAREFEKSAAAKRGAWAGLVTSSGIMIIWTIVKSSLGIK